MRSTWWEHVYIYLSWWCRDLIFFFALVDYSTPRLYMEIRSCCSAADSRTDRDTQWMVRKKSTIFISTLLFVFFLFTWNSYILTLYWLMSQPPDRIWKHHFILLTQTAIDIIACEGKVKIWHLPIFHFFQLARSPHHSNNDIPVCPLNTICYNHPYQTRNRKQGTGQVR